VARLHKRYEGGFIAVKSISLGINKRECFGLLGHNGAGKSTTLNMLCGLFEPTSGDARIGDTDLSIKTELPLIHGQMGVCPQHDVLWNSLSATDHLNFYGRLKGLSGSALSQEVERLLKAVNLHNFPHRNAGAFSGGMKRRLSVAISLIGNPTVGK
jgi:ABC-type multidrug transport system ATPase subunit